MIELTNCSLAMIELTNCSLAMIELTNCSLRVELHVYLWTVVSVS
jgi:hypothetical protein